MTAADLAHALGAKRSGRQWLCRCVAHEDREPSMLIFDGHTGVQVRCLAGCTPHDIIASLRDRGLWGSKQDVDGEQHHASHQRLSAPRNAAIQHQRIADGTHRALGLRIFDEAAPLTQSRMARDYLAGRKLNLPPSRVARFHPNCPRGDERCPAIVVRMEPHGSSKLCAIQRIYLHREADGRVVKHGTPMMLGSARHAAMKLTPHHATFWDELAYCPVLNICEGFETGLALLRDGVEPTWALGSAGAIAAMPIVFAIGAITVWADNDHSRFSRAGEIVNPGMDAGRACCRRWAEAGRPARLMWRATEGTDFADA